MKKSRMNVSTNKNASINSRVDRTGKFRTETTRRDADAVTAAVSTNERTNSTRLFIDIPEYATISFSGGEARTLFRLLSAHYARTGKSFR